jgi:hypothetical protein
MRTAPVGPLELGAGVDLGPVTLRIDGIAHGGTTSGSTLSTGAHVEACVAGDTKAPVAFTLDSWHLVVPDGSHRAASDHWDEHAEPGAPMQGALVEPGDCITGWVVFDAPPPSGPAAVRYANVAGDEVQWRFKTS